MSFTTIRRDKKVLSGPLQGSDDLLFRAAGFEDQRVSRTARGLVEGIVLAGVHTWGHSTLDDVICWPLVPVAGQPLLGHTLSWMASAGIRSVNICANSDTLQVSRAFRDGTGSGVALEYYEDRMPRGPAGCIRDVVVDRRASLFVVVDGSVLPNIDLATVLESHSRSNAAVTVVVASTPGGPPLNQRLTPVGVYVFSRRVADHIGRVGYQDVKEKLIPRLHAKGHKVATHMVGSVSLPRIRCAASYLTVNKSVTETLVKENATKPQFRRVASSLVHETAVVSPSAKLVGPVLIDAGCVVEADAMVVGPTSIGEGSRICRRAVISRSAVWSGCCVSQEAIVDDCVVANGVTIAAGLVQRNAVCARSMNRRFWGARV